MAKIYRITNMLLIIWRIIAVAAQTFLAPNRAQGMLLRGVTGNFNGGGGSRDSENPKCAAAGYHSSTFDRDEYERARGINPVAVHRKKCKHASSNARGIYTSHLVPCTFQFFQISKEQPDDLHPLAMSTACFDTSPMQNQPPFEDYIVRWPDECLTDFVRCYSLKRDEHILLRYMCAKKEPFKFPEGATHVSVNCTEDQKEKQERIKKQEADRK